MIKVILLMGGLFSADGFITSTGMTTIGSQLARLPHVTVQTYLWGDINRYAAEVRKPFKGKIVVIGYSGGGMSATWLANLPNKPRIDLMIDYDPSPSWNMKPVGSNVKKAVCYCNKSQMLIPLVGWIGGGQLKSTKGGPRVEVVQINEPHLAVQFDSSLHSRTVKYVKGLK